MKPIRELLEIPGPCLTLVLAANGPGEAQIEIKHAVESLRKRMNGDSETLLASVIEEAKNLGNAAKPRGSIVMLRAPSMFETFHVDEPLEHKAQLADRFDIRTLLTIEHSQRAFYVLALSQSRTRLLRCTVDGSEEARFPEGTAVSLMDAMQTRKPDHVLDNRQAIPAPTAGAMGGVMFGTNTDAEAKDEYMLHFFMGLDSAVNIALKGHREPLIPVGVEHELALFKRVNTYPRLLTPGVHGAPDGLDGNEMHRRAMEFLREVESRPDSHVPADFDKRVGVGRASTHIQDIVAAAWEGRVSHFFFQANASYMGSFDPVRRRVKHTEDPLDAPVNLVDSAAEQTVLHAGDVRILPGSAMPNGLYFCALFRY